MKKGRVGEELTSQNAILQNTTERLISLWWCFCIFVKFHDLRNDNYLTLL